jgi:hypothetical protein
MITTAILISQETKDDSACHVVRSGFREGGEMERKMQHIYFRAHATQFNPVFINQGKERYIQNEVCGEE